jgi:hypothetical protein
VGDDPSLLELLQVEGESGLGRMEGLLELADAPLPTGKVPNDGQTGLLSQSLEAVQELDFRGDMDGMHGMKYINEN